MRVIRQVDGNHMTFSRNQIAQALEFESTHVWQASENVVVKFDRRKGFGKCLNEEEARWHFEFLTEVTREIDRWEEENVSTVHLSEVPALALDEIDPESSSVRAVPEGDA